MELDLETATIVKDRLCYVHNFISEYRRITLSKDVLDAVIESYEGGISNLKLPCPVSILKKQSQIMKDYKNILEERARLEGITL